MKFTRLVIGAYALLMLPLAASAQSIVNLDPLEWDYGVVSIGTEGTKVFSFDTEGGDSMNLYGIVILYDQPEYRITSVRQISGEDEIELDPPYEYSISVGDSIEIEVAFVPETEELVSATLYIGSSADNLPNIFIPLQGEGLLYVPTPAEMMDALLEFFDQAVADGDIVGSGNSQGARNAHVRIVGNMLDSADAFIEAEEYTDACEALTDAVLRSDGNHPPPDFVEGDAVPTLNTMILEVMDALGC